MNVEKLIPQILAQRAECASYQEYIEKYCELAPTPELVMNPYSGQGCILPPIAVAVHDTVKGLEVLLSAGHVELQEMFLEGLDWFSKNYPDEYFVLLD